MKTREVIEHIEQEARLVQGEASKDTSFSSQKSFPDEATARAAFPRSVEKLLKVSGWSALGTFLADFELYDSTVKPKLAGDAQPGDYIRIIMPGPVPINWVRVIHAAADDKAAEFTVQPCPNPEEDEPEHTEHFFTNESRSTFRVELAGATIRAFEIGQDETINNQQPQAGNRAIINTIIAETGWLFYQKMQWKHLTDYLVDV